MSAGAVDGVAGDASLDTVAVARPGTAGVLRRVLTRLALGAPVRVFVLEGTGVPGLVDALRLRDDIQLVDTPRSATVLLVAGQLPAALDEPAARAHDAMANPRAVVWWTRPAGADAASLPPMLARLPVTQVVDDSPGGIAEASLAIRRVHSALLRGERASDPPLLPDVDPAPWRGVGPFGQGGAGMTGGVPYGRPMTARAPDRDGLELDQLPVRVGPFFAPFPAGLVLDVLLQGDVVQEVTVPGNAFAIPFGAPDSVAAGDRVLIADVERARARHHLRWLAHALRVHGLDALARRTLGLAVALVEGMPTGAAADVLALGRLLERTRALGWATAGVGVTRPALVAGLGPVARAAGLAEDARLDDAAYRALGFEPVVQRGSGIGDARARRRQRVAEAAQSLDLAARAGDAQTGGPAAAIEGPRGPMIAGAHREAASTTPSATLLALLPDLLRGVEWGDAVTTVVSLDIDVHEAAPGAAPLAPPPVPKPAAGGMGGMGGMGGSESGGQEQAHDAHGGGMS